MAMSTNLKNQLLNNWFRNTTFDMPNTFYLGLSTTTPNEDGTGVTEPKAASYVRLGVAANTTNWTTAASGNIKNAVALRFDEAVQAWSTSTNKITSYVIYDAATNGNLLFFGSLATPQEIPENSVMEIPINGLQTGIANA